MVRQKKSHTRGISVAFVFLDKSAGYLRRQKQTFYIPETLPVTLVNRTTSQTLVYTVAEIIPLQSRLHAKIM